MISQFQLLSEMEIDLQSNSINVCCGRFLTNVYGILNESFLSYNIFFHQIMTRSILVIVTFFFKYVYVENTAYTGG